MIPCVSCPPSHIYRRIWLHMHLYSYFFLPCLFARHSCPLRTVHFSTNDSWLDLWMNGSFSTSDPVVSWLHFCYSALRFPYKLSLVPILYKPFKTQNTLLPLVDTADWKSVDSGCKSIPIKGVDSTEHCWKLTLVATLGKMVGYIGNFTFPGNP